jgi:hypothetical protein
VQLLARLVERSGHVEIAIAFQPAARQRTDRLDGMQIALSPRGNVNRDNPASRA